MRYFLFHFAFMSKKENGVGSALIKSSGGFPSHKSLKEDLAEGAQSITILGWSEFKDKEDYENFNKE